MTRMMVSSRRALMVAMLSQSLGCSMVASILAPAPVVPRHAIQRVVPVPRLVAPGEAIGSCVRYASNGAVTLETCPAALVGMSSSPIEYKAASGEHDAGLFLIDPAAPPPGYSGQGGYWQVRESHVTRVLSAVVTTGRLGALQLDRVDALCQDVARAGDRVVVDRAYVGCAVVAEGSGDVPASSAAALEQLAAQNRRLGRPKDFRIDEGKNASCEGDETTVLLGVTKLSTICNDVVREHMLARVTKEANASLAELAKAERDLEAKELALAAIDTHDRLAREKAASLLTAHQALESQIRVLSQTSYDAHERMLRYSNDPYGLRDVADDGAGLPSLARH